MRIHYRSIAGGALLVSVAFSQGGAQVITSRANATKDSAAATGGARLFSHRDLVIAGLMAAGTVALFPLDKRLAGELQDSATQTNHFFKSAAKGFETIASPGAYVIGGSLYLLGRVSGHNRIADLGWHGTEAVLVGEGISYVLKGAVGRGRPYLSNAKTPDDFDLGRGFKSGDWRSFPSGHSTTAFAAAAAVTDEKARWFPNSTKFVGPAMYGGATLVGLSRMYHNRHWASDVALGAMIGTFSGRKVVQVSHTGPQNRIDRLMLGMEVVPNRYGTLNVGWNHRF
jgi:hypothetical protein